MLDDFSYNLQKLCRTCYEEGRHILFEEGKCPCCKGRNVNAVYVNAKDFGEFVRDFRNSDSVDRGNGVRDCNHKDIKNKFNHATINQKFPIRRACSFAMNMFESSIWNWMITHKKYKIMEIYNHYVAPFVFTLKLNPPCQNVHHGESLKQYCKLINPVPRSPDDNLRIQAEEKKADYFCWFCLKTVISEHEIKPHIMGSNHTLCYESDKKRRWYFKMPYSNSATVCHDENCTCLAAHTEDELLEMKARIKFRNFKDNTVDNMAAKNIKPWPPNVTLKLPLFPRNIDCYNKSIRVTVELHLNIGWSLSYVCLRDSESRPFFCLHDNYSNKKGQFLKWESTSNSQLKKVDFDIEFSPTYSGTYVQRLEFEFLFHDETYCCQELIRSDVGSSKHLKAFRTIFEKYESILKRDIRFDHIVPFSMAADFDNTVLSEDLLRRVFRVVSNLQWFETRVAPWNYCDWMRDMMVHEELEQQLLLSQLVFMGDIKISDTFTKAEFIHSKSDQLFGTIEFKNECHNSFSREFLVKNVVKAFVLTYDQNDRRSLYECDIIDKHKYHTESRSMKEVTLCLSERTVRDLQLKSGTVYQNIIIYFRYNRLMFERRHRSLDKMPHYDRLTFTPLSCPYFTRVPFGEDQSAVYFEPKLRLNTEQRRLPRLVLRDLQNDETVLPFILNGAFGTGKSSVIAETVVAILKSANDGARILICTRSYSAGQVYLTMFESRLSQERLREIKMIIPPEKKIKPKYSLNNSALNKAIFEANRVFITSLDNVADAMAKVSEESDEDGTKFDYIFVDEAAQVLEVDAIMVYQFGNKRSKFIFAGDVFQVRPEVYNMNLKKFPVPIVSRLHAVYNQCPDYEICLRTVYRSHPILVKYLSDAIYCKYELKAAMPASSNDLLPMKFIDANSDGKTCEEFDEVFYSYTNEIEADLITNGVEIYLNKLNSDKKSFSEVLVCSPFYSQVKLIRDKLKQKRLSVTVEMPSAIQGMEFDAVFISTVLTVNNEQKYPIRYATFHNNKNLINLAISRARYYVEVVGDKQCLLTLNCKVQWDIFIKSSS